MIERLLVAALALVVVVAIPAAAEARKRIVVLEVGGPGGDTIARQLGLLIERRHATVTGSRFARTARELGAQARNEENIARVARYLAVDGVVVGEITKRADSYRLIVRLREGRTGKFVQTIAVRLEAPELTRAAARQIWRVLMPTIDGLPPVSIVEDEGDEAEPTPPPPDDLGGDERAEPETEAPPETDPPPPAEADGAEVLYNEDAENPLAPATPEPDPAPPADATTGGPPAFELHTGISVSNRSFAFSHEPDLDDPPQDYRGAVVPGAYLNAELYPLAFSRSGALAGLGITGTLDHVLRIQTRVRYEGTVTELPTSQSQFGLGILYRYDFASDGQGLALKGSLRFSRLAFRLDRTPSPVEIDVPSVNYTYLDPGLAAYYPFGPVAVYAEVRGVLVLSTGEIQQLDEYGTATVTGLEAGAGIEYAIAGGFVARAGFDYTGISHAFTGDGARTDRGGAAAIDVVGAHDRYVGGYLTVGYMY